MSRRDESREAWGDAVYEAWRHGFDSDRVDRERIEDDIYGGATREESVANELRHIAPAEAEGGGRTVNGG